MAGIRWRAGPGAGRSRNTTASPCPAAPSRSANDDEQTYERFTSFPAHESRREATRSGEGPEPYSLAEGGGRPSRQAPLCDRPRASTRAMSRFSMSNLSDHTNRPSAAIVNPHPQKRSRIRCNCSRTPSVVPEMQLLTNGDQRAQLPTIKLTMHSWWSALTVARRAVLRAAGCGEPCPHRRGVVREPVRCCVAPCRRRRGP
jgi:hypothetical protein